MRVDLNPPWKLEAGISEEGEITAEADFPLPQAGGHKCLGSGEKNLEVGLVLDKRPTVSCLGEHPNASDHLL